MSLNEEANSDHELMDLAADGDTEAFKRLFEKYKVPIYNYLYCLTHDGPVAEELAQETFLRVFRSRSEYSRSAKFSTWLWTIARHAAIDHLRKKKEILSNDLGKNALGEAPEIEPSDAETLLVERAEQQALEDCMNALPASQREAMAMRVFSECDYAEIAAATKSSLPAVKSILHRARVSLVNCLKRKAYAGT